ncbi:MAG: glycosyltransferase family 4 protein [Propionibacteriales bacterium]|nr:glycosyltransferase family 4 protein [Propionibacteriales bacterium]
MTKLRVAMVCPYSWGTPGGVQNHVLGLAGWLTARGHLVEVFAPGHPDPATLVRHGLGADQFVSAGWAVPVPYNGSVAKINFGPRTHRRVRQWLNGGDFDVLHLHEPITPSAAVLALWSAGTVPVVATFHTATPRSRTMHLARRVLRGSVARIDAGIAVSQTARRVVVDHLARDADIIPNGIRHDHLRGGDGPRSPLQMVYLGRLNEPRKGLDVLLRAWPEIRRRHPGAELLLAGAGQRRLPPGCRALGVVSDQVRTELLTGADLFIAPHRGRESFGLVVAEAMAAGAHVVAADIPAFVDVLSDERGIQHGELFAAGDALALVEAVTRAVDGSSDASRARAREVARRYDWGVVGPQILGVYEQARSASGVPAQPPSGVPAQPPSGVPLRSDQTLPVAEIATLAQ